jgi:hypothetical protein
MPTDRINSIHLPDDIEIDDICLKVLKSSIILKREVFLKFNVTYPLY